MAGQLFPRWATPLGRVAFVAVLLAVPLALAAALLAVRSPYVTGAERTVEQPVPFSHAHHAGKLAIDCRYCHTGVERSAFAGIPPTHTCMTCHSQLWTEAEMLAPVRRSLATGEPLRWRRVTALPDYVFFDHSVHVAAGVGCESCHGRVDRMPLVYPPRAFFMGFCLDCHRRPEAHLRPRAAVFVMGWQPPPDRAALGRRLVEAYGVRTEQLTDCSVCHR